MKKTFSLPPTIIRILGNPVSVCEINMFRLKEEFRQSLKLEQSLKNNFRVKEDSLNLGKERLLKYAAYGMDWITALSLSQDNPDEIMEVRYFKCEYANKVEYEPFKISKDGRIIVIKGQIKKGCDIIMTNSYVPLHDFSIKGYIDFTSYNYGLNKWKELKD